MQKIGGFIDYTYLKLSKKIRSGLVKSESIYYEKDLNKKNFLKTKDATVKEWESVRELFKVYKKIKRKKSAKEIQTLINKSNLDKDELVTILVNSKLKFEEVNSFDNDIYPCYYFKKDNGYIVFFKYSDNIFDLGIYDINKNLISMVIDYKTTIKDLQQEHFIGKLIS